MCVTFLSMKHLRRLNVKQPLFHNPSTFCRVKYAQAGMERDRSGVEENTVLFDENFGNSNRNFQVEWNAPTAFGYALHWLHFFPAFAIGLIAFPLLPSVGPVGCFPSLAIGYIFSRACYRFDCFPALTIGRLCSRSVG